MFSKKVLFFKRTEKNCFWGPCLFWEEECVWWRKWIKPFLWERRFWIFFHLIIFLRKWGKKILGGTRGFSRIRNLMLKINITFFNCKLDAKYFHVKQFFCKSCIFWGNGKELFCGRMFFFSVYLELLFCDSIYHYNLRKKL